MNKETLQEIEEIIKLRIQNAENELKQYLLEKIDKLPKYMENNQPLNEKGRFVRLEDIKQLLKKNENT